MSTDERMMWEADQFDVIDEDGPRPPEFSTPTATGHRSQRMQQGEYDKLVALLDAGLTEYRSVPFVDFESKDDGWTFEGLAAVYDQESDVGPFTEEFRHGSFRKPLANGDNTRLIYEHAPPHLPVLGTIRGGTLILKDDVRGLVTRGRIAQHYLGEAVRELIQRGDVKGMSPGMIVGRGNSQITARSDGRLHRAIMALKHLPEVSLTSDPVYAGTTAEMRSMWALAESLGDWQHALMGTYPQLESRAIVEPGTNKDEAEPAPETQEREERCEKCDAVIDGEHECAPVPEQRSGVDTAEAEVAARRRRLHMMGLSLPQDQTWTPSRSHEERSETRVAPREVDEVIQYPRETWTPEERQLVAERRSRVQQELFGLASEAERVGRNLTAEESARFGRLQDEFVRLGR